MDALLETRVLCKTYRARGSALNTVFGRRAALVKAVDEVSFNMPKGEVLAIVGESGSGKSTLGRLIAGLEAPSSGDVLLASRPLAEWRRAKPKELRRAIQVIFQDPYDSLNPRMSIGAAIEEPLACLLNLSRAERRRRVLEMLEMVELVPATDFSCRYPAELSGGQRQRVAIARALVVRPTIVVADEPVSMLDVSVRAEVLALMRRLRTEVDATYVFITHDLAVAHHFADRLLTMYLGRVVEIGETKDTIANPLHPYTRALLSAVPSRDVSHPRGAVRIRAATALKNDHGCAFQPRCPDATERCIIDSPNLRRIDGTWVACHYAEKFLDASGRSGRQLTFTGGRAARSPLLENP